ncbi:hypothetical protein AB2M62_14930 [Sphingomonas sp. MMS12-HWE2-04]|uniref:hypothetical protein n=1 Tax=Sphingomonas sp. MMS12-HWE2-04 TaxID=3234199 RepID=UPI003850D306
MFKYALIAGIAFLSSPALAQDGTLDVMAYGHDAANVGRTNVMNNAIRRSANRQRGGSELSPQAEATCARRFETRRRLGADDPRVQEIFRLCAVAGR